MLMIAIIFIGLSLVLFSMAFLIFLLSRKEKREDEDLYSLEENPWK